MHYNVWNCIQEKYDVMSSILGIHPVCGAGNGYNEGGREWDSRGSWCSTVSRILGMYGVMNGIPGRTLK
jgi:hypothetical protein